MKKMVSAFLALILSLGLTAGCSQDPATIEGVWTSADGSTLTLNDGILTLTDSMGENMLAKDQLPYEHRGDFLYIFIDGVEVRAFETVLDADFLTLTYTVNLQADFQTAVDQPIELTRADD